MDGEGNGLNLQGLAQRLETLTERLGGLERENAGLRQEVAALRGSGKNGAAVVEEAASGSLEGRVSRGWLLRNVGAAAVAAVAAGTLLTPREAKANHYDDAIFVNAVHTHLVNVEAQGTSPAVLGLNTSAEWAALHGRNSGAGPGVMGRNEGDGSGVEGVAIGTSGMGIKGTGRYGVWGESNQAGFYGVTGRNTNADGTGVRGVANNSDGRAGVRGEGATGIWGSSSRTGYSGVYGQHTGSSGFGIVGDGKGSGSAGVLGRNSGGEGVRGEGSTQAEVAGVRGLGKTGVWGSSSTTGYSGVYGQHTGSAGFGVVGDGRGASGAGVLGRNPSGYGGQFEGGKAQVRLVPGGSADAPGSGAHLKGELYMDSGARLFVCTADGTPGTWRRITTN